MVSDNINIKIESLFSFVNEEEFNNQKIKIKEKLNNIDKYNDIYKDSLGWINPLKYTNTSSLDDINRVATKIKELGSVLVLIGIGGSNQGARAIIEALDIESSCSVIWAGNNLSSHEAQRVLNSIGDRNFCIDVIAKNFETVEPGLAFRIFRDALIKKYGDSYRERVFCTGTKDSYFNRLCTKEKYTFLEFPEDLGGRFSIFSPVGLLPIAVSSINIHKLCSGLRQLANSINKSENLIDYIAFRTLLGNKGYPLEMMSFFEDRLFRFGKWWMQLIGESEGKDNKGIFPVIGNFSEDLHSIGQFIQEGNPIIFETFIKILNQKDTIKLEKNGVEDHFDYVNNKSLLSVNKISEMATIKAHSQRLPVCVFEIDKMDERTIGSLMYFYMYSTYISCLAIDVNPFNQMGVELYKKWMFEGLGKTKKS